MLTLIILILNVLSNRAMGQLYLLPHRKLLFFLYSRCLPPCFNLCFFSYSQCPTGWKRKRGATPRATTVQEAVKGSAGETSELLDQASTTIVPDLALLLLGNLWSGMTDGTRSIFREIFLSWYSSCASCDWDSCI